MSDLPEMNVHIEGTPDVCDIVHPGDWLVETDEIGDVFSMVVKVTKHKEGQLDFCPGAESWTIHHIGTGYMTGGNVSAHDCCFINGIVAVNGELLQLYKLGWNEETKIRVVQGPDEDIEVPATIYSLIKHLNPIHKNTPLQLALF